MARKNVVDNIHSELNEEEAAKLMALIKRKDSHYYRLTKAELVRSLLEEAFQRNFIK